MVVVMSVSEFPNVEINNDTSMEDALPKNNARGAFMSGKAFGPDVDRAEADS
jgi:hypothetical protein